MNKEYKPLVSVILPSFNHAQYIEEAINSVINQTYKNWELIVIDDGSTDNTHEILQQIPPDNRISIILSKSNKRQSARLNQGINLAKGEYISFISSDDWYMPEKLEKQVSLFKSLSSEYGVVYSGGYRYFDESQTRLEAKTNNSMKRGWILKELLLEPFFIYPISPLIRKSCYNKLKYDESYLAEGEAMHFKIAMTYKYDFVSEPLVTMREHAYNAGGNIDKMLEDNIRYRKDLFSHKDFPPNLLKYRGEILGKIYKLKGWEYIRLRKNYTKGRKALYNAIKSDNRLFLDKRVIVGILLSIIPKSVKKILTK